MFGKLSWRVECSAVFFKMNEDKFSFVSAEESGIKFQRGD